MPYVSALVRFLLDQIGDAVLDLGWPRIRIDLKVDESDGRRAEGSIDLPDASEVAQLLGGSENALATPLVNGQTIEHAR
jgi:hypothetical protein